MLRLEVLKPSKNNQLHQLSAAISLCAKMVGPPLCLPPNDSSHLEDVHEKAERNIPAPAKRGEIQALGKL